MLERVGFVLANFLEVRRCSLALVLKVCPEEFVCLVNTVGDILQSLRAYFLEIAEPLNLLEFGQMFLQGKFVQRFVVEMPILLMESDAMIISQTCGVDLPMQLLIPLRGIELELVGLDSFCYCNSPPCFLRIDIPLDRFTADIASG